MVFYIATEESGVNTPEEELRPYRGEFESELIRRESFLRKRCLNERRLSR